ncbi:AT-rich interactive domain-containing protein 5 [Heracleum sosnowskyi]|uniref:AT-rich interactive domain-containing protein 5 n=1 Tax=Heracleum sosnowskyi TaxID=360622 RepID=A0AAD8JD70_9APIA|nr:AT-rich interactive domain-containing protein 5 [Heracleum sosnowskyi]
MDDTDVEIKNTDKMEVDLTNDTHNLLTSKETQQEGKDMHLEGQNSFEVEKDQKSVDIAINHQILGETGMQNSGVHSDILGEKTGSKYTMENQNISGENLVEKDKNMGKSPQECTLLPSAVEADQSGVAANNVDDAVKNAIPEIENKRSANKLNDKPHSYHTRPAADQVEPVTPVTNETFKVKGVDTNDIKTIEEAETGTPEEQAAFMKELETFFRENGMVFRPPKFYGKLLNCLKLYRSVIRHGGYDRVTAAKSVWRQIGESFNPPKTCTTAAYAFRIFYEKALLEYERHKMKTGELQLAFTSVPGPVATATNATTGSGRARRDAAARAMQGWHEQRYYGYGEIAEPIIKDKNFNLAKREKLVKNIGSVKNKRLKEVEHPVKAARMETSKQLVSSVVDVGPPADWVKISVREHKDCFEVYALVPGLLREEVRVQSDPEGRLVITGQPEQRDNPWGITAFQKVISLPARIDPLQTSAVVGLHGRLFVRIPFDRSM